MPSASTSAFFSDEWQRFVQGVQRLNPRDYRNIRDYWARQQLPPGYQNIISPVGWEDVVRWPHGPALTGADFREVLKAAREGRLPNLPDDVIAAVGAAIEQRNRMLGAPDAEITSSWGRIYNAIDNVQDLIVTAGLLGKLAVWIAPEALGFLAPVAGAALTVAGLLAMLNLLAMIAAPLLTLLCKGPAQALVAGVPALLFGPALKARAWKAALLSPLSRSGWLRGALGPFTRRNWIALLSQAPQVTTSLWGYGISLGAIVGVITQSAAGIAAEIRGDPVHWPPFRPASGTPREPFLREPGQPQPDTPGGAQLHQLINRPLHDDAVPDIVLLHQCATIMVAAPSVLRRPEIVTPEIYTQTLAALAQAQTVVYRRLHGYAWQPLLEEALDHGLSSYLVAPTHSLPLYEEHGLAEGDWLPWDVPGAPLTITGEKFMATYPASLQAGVERFCRQHERTGWGSLAGALVNQMVDESWEQLAGQDFPIRWEFTPDWYLLTNLAECNRIPLPTARPQDLWALWQAAKADLEAHGAGWYTAERWDELGARFGVRMIRLLPPDAPWPPEWRDWLASQAHAAQTNA
jgi:hypothetical protein